MLKPVVLLSADDCCISDRAIKECLGDRFLYANNPLFHCVRELFLGNGFKYIDQHGHDAVSGYIVAPFLSLPDLIQSGTVPYKNTREILERILAREPQFEIAAPMLVSQISHNALLHESAHLIADSVLPKQGQSNEMPSFFVVRALLCEAYANIIEYLSLAYATQSHVHRLFLALNCYIPYHSELERNSRLIATLVDLFGLQNMLTFGTLCFLHSNLHERAPSDAVMCTWRSLVFTRPLCGAQAALLDLAARILFSLNPSFRDGTTATFFRMLGWERYYQDLRRTELTHEVIEELRLMDRIQLLIEPLCGCARLNVGVV